MSESPEQTELGLNNPEQATVTPGSESGSLEVVQSPTAIVGDETAIKWPVDDRGNPLRSGEIMILSHKAREAGDIAHADALLGLVKKEDPTLPQRLSSQLHPNRPVRRDRQIVPVPKKEPRNWYSNND